MSVWVHTALHSTVSIAFFLSAREPTISWGQALCSFYPRMWGYVIRALILILFCIIVGRILFFYYHFSTQTAIAIYNTYYFWVSNFFTSVFIPILFARPEVSWEKKLDKIASGGRRFRYQMNTYISSSMTGQMKFEFQRKRKLKCKKCVCRWDRWKIYTRVHVPTIRADDRSPAIHQ